MDDNAPFFFFTLKTDQILHDGGLQKGIDWKVNLGVVVLGVVFVISALAVWPSLFCRWLCVLAAPSAHCPCFTSSRWGSGYIPGSRSAAFSDLSRFSDIPRAR